jgi:hypothetical protein
MAYWKWPCSSVSIVTDLGQYQYFDIHVVWDKSRCQYQYYDRFCWCCRRNTGAGISFVTEMNSKITSIVTLTDVCWRISSGASISTVTDMYCIGGVLTVMYNTFCTYCTVVEFLAEVSLLWRTYTVEEVPVPISVLWQMCTSARALVQYYDRHVLQYTAGLSVPL